MLVKPRDTEKQTVFYNKVPSVTLSQVQKSKIIRLSMANKKEVIKSITISKNSGSGLWYGGQTYPTRYPSDLLTSDDGEIVSIINALVKTWWKKDDVTDVSISIANTRKIFVKNKNVAPRWKQHSGGVPDYIHLGYKEPFGKNTKTKVPSKLESKGMKQHSKVNKSNSLTKSYKKMTGDVTTLGKNFNKLI